MPNIWLLRMLARLVACLSSRVRAYDPVAILDEFAGLLRAETDFISEAGNLEAVRRTFEVSDAVTIPRVLAEMSGESVLVMDWIEGIPLSDRERLETAKPSQGPCSRSVEPRALSTRLSLGCNLRRSSRLLPMQV